VQSFRVQERPTIVQFDKGVEIEDIFAGDGMSMAVAKHSSDKVYKASKMPILYGWGMNKYNMLHVDKQDTKTKKLFNPFKIKIEPKYFGKQSNDDENDYALEFNLNAPSDFTFYHTKRNRTDKLPEHEKKIDQLHTENFKLQNEIRVKQHLTFSV